MDLNQPTVAARLANPNSDANALVNSPGYGSDPIAQSDLHQQLQLLYKSR